MQEQLDPNLQLCFDLALETMEHINDSYRARGFEARRTYENVCNVVTYVAKRASNTSTRESTEVVGECK